MRIKTFFFFVAIALLLIPMSRCWASSVLQSPPPITGYAESEGAIPEGNLRRTGVHTSAGPTPPLQQEWRISFGNGGLSAPTVAKGTVYIGDTKYLYAIDAKTGERKWRFRTGNHVHTPTFTKGMVLAASDDGYVYAIDPKSGKEIWSFDYRGEFISAGPIVSRGLLYIGTAFSQESTAYVQSVGVRYGEEKWTYKVEGYIGGISADKSRVYFGSTDGGILYSLNKISGKEIWRFGTRGGIYSHPVVGIKRIYIDSEDGYIYSLDKRTGDEIWNYYNGTGIPSLENYDSPALSDGVLFSFSEINSRQLDKRSNIVSINSITGNKIAISEEVFRPKTSIFISEESKCFSDERYLYCFFKGKGMDKFSTNGVVKEQPVVNKGRLYVPTEKGYLHSIK